MDGAAESSVSRALARWVVGFKAEQAPIEARHEAGRSLMDVVGVSIAGAGHKVCGSVRSVALVEHGVGDCTVLGSAQRGSAMAAALVNGTASHVLDFDDVSYEGMVHASAVVWPAVWAAAESVDCSGTAAFDGFVAGVEVHCALGRAFGHDLFWNGYWTTGLLGSVAAAAGAAKALSLDAAKTTAAIDIALAQASGLRAIVGTPMKAVACGLAAEAGVRSAMLARAGIAVGADVVGHRHGFAALLNEGAVRMEELALLGHRYVFEQAPMAFKQYPICSYGQAATEALCDALADLDEPVARVLCEVPASVLDNMPFGTPQNASEAQFSLPFALGAVLAFGALLPSHLAADVVADSRLVAALSRVDVRLASGAALRALQSCSEGAVLTVTGLSGRVVSRTVRVPSGMPQRPLSDAQLVVKFHACVDPVLGAIGASELRQRLAEMPSSAGVRTLCCAVPDQGR
jgi:2-methylcitrate dehydratase PrpD